MNAMDFQFSAMPKLIFGTGRIGEAATLARAHGPHVLLVTGRRSFEAASDLLSSLKDQSLHHDHVIIDSEPTPAMVDDAAQKHPHVNAVIAVGGGAAIDAGKAISAMIPMQKPVRDYLEGVGTQTPTGDKVPFIACPTTAGTGAEATKNAVLSEIGPAGFKKSLRHDRYIPDAVVIDPALARGCPPPITAACGMDALTQLLEAFVSPAASAMTDALARSGLASAARSLVKTYDAPEDLEARADMAWAAFCSGLCLAHAGLGVVHGFASPIGGFYPIPHGVVCGTLLPAAAEANVGWLCEHDADGLALAKHAEVGRMLGSEAQEDSAAAQQLVQSLHALKQKLGIPPLSQYGVGIEDRILDGAGLKNNPGPLDRVDLIEILKNAGAS